MWVPGDELQCTAERKRELTFYTLRKQSVLDPSFLVATLRCVEAPYEVSDKATELILIAIDQRFR